MTENNPTDRRTFLKGIGVSALGLGGAMAASGLAAAQESLDVWVTHEGTEWDDPAGPASYNLDYEDGGTVSGSVSPSELDYSSESEYAKLQDFSVENTGSGDDHCKVLFEHSPKSTLSTTVDGKATVKGVNGSSLYYELHIVEGGDIQIIDNDELVPESVEESPRANAGKVGYGRVHGGKIDEWDVEGQFEAIRVYNVTAGAGIDITRDLF
jgi:hypothetical protein